MQHHLFMARSLTLPSRPSAGAARIAAFISPHGFGHAARCSAVLSALHRRIPQMHVDIFTLTPRWFFERSIDAPFSYHEHRTDIGMIQPSPLHENLEKTIAHLEGFIPFDPQWIDRIARQLDRWGCRLVLCDIAPTGIAVARRAGIPSVLVENFTWDWIYRAYAEKDRRFAIAACYLRERFQEADAHIQTEPLCRKVPWADMTVPPISRPFRTPPAEVRRQLGVPETAPLVLITMGGFQTDYDFWDALGAHREIWFIIPGAGARSDAGPNIICLPQDSPFFHPDLVRCADVVVAKSGYSTIAEVCQAGAAYACVLRPDFPEAQVLEAYIRSRLESIFMTEAEFQSGRWLDRGLLHLLARRRRRRAPSDGADKVAAFIHARLRNGNKIT